VKEIEHAFGGAIALAYWTREPRGTRDIDLNIFAPAADPEPALEALPDGVSQPRGTVAKIRQNGQIRLRWDDTPVDLFFDYAPIHRDAARDRRIVPFEETQIPVLGPVELAAFKAMLDRTRDWADIEEMFAAGSLASEELHEAIRSMLGPDDERHARIESAGRRGGGA
jgi:hypothetical protein